MPSFDVICEVDAQEVRNAVEQASRELRSRFDFRGVDASFEFSERGIELAALHFRGSEVIEEFALAQLVIRQCDRSEIYFTEHTGQ